MTVLTGHTSPDTAYLITDYPYGFTLRCQMRVWIETSPKFGQRVMSQTSNPKKPGLVWNKPKASTYAPIKVLFLDDQNHVQNAELTFYADEAKITAFEMQYGEAMTSDRDQKEIAMLRVMARRLQDREALRTTPRVQ